MKKLATTFGLLALMLVVTSFTSPNEIGGKSTQGTLQVPTYNIGGKSTQGTLQVPTYNIGGKSTQGTLQVPK
jgi:hypothetical protein